MFPDSVDQIESLLNLPDRSMMENLLAMDNIKQHQDQCRDLYTLQIYTPARFPTKTINGHNLIVYQEQNKERWRIFLPSSLVNDMVKWYQFALGHYGNEKLYDTVFN